MVQGCHKNLNKKKMNRIKKKKRKNWCASWKYRLFWLAEYFLSAGSGFYLSVYAQSCSWHMVDLNMYSPLNVYWPGNVFMEAVGWPTRERGERERAPLQDKNHCKLLRKMHWNSIHILTGTVKWFDGNWRIRMREHTMQQILGVGWKLLILMVPPTCKNF